jgi:hypothetical protein
MRKAEQFYYKFFFKKIIFLVISTYLVMAAVDTLFVAGYLVLNDSVPAHLEAALGQQEASQLRLYSPGEKKVRRGDFWQIGWVADCVWLQGTPAQRHKCGLRCNVSV